MINGLTTFVKGEGKPLVFLHGYLSSKESFYYQTEYFSRFFKVYAPDLPGFKENCLPYPYSLGDYAHIVDGFFDEVLKETGYSSAHVVAHSFGARIVFYLSPTSKFDKIVLTGAAGIKTRKRLSVKLKIAAYKFVKRVFHKSIKLFESPDYQALSPVMKQSFNKIIAEDLTDKLAFIENQTLIVNGTLDRETPLKTAMTINKKIKNSQLITIVGAGHFCFVDEPIKFDLAVKEFLS